MLSVSCALGWNLVFALLTLMHCGQTRGKVSTIVPEFYFLIQSGVFELL
uniref:Uncharacterized protein n=1 Tax=Anguilla anguilla TaxID=7936 RepID=A0A0E9R5B2_ANGAN